MISYSVDICNPLVCFWHSRSGTFLRTLATGDTFTNHSVKSIYILLCTPCSFTGKISITTDGRNSQMSYKYSPTTPMSRPFFTLFPSGCTTESVYAVFSAHRARNSMLPFHILLVVPLSDWRYGVIFIAQ